MHQLATTGAVSTSNGGLMVGVVIVALCFWLFGSFQKATAEYGRKAAGGGMVIAVLVLFFLIKIGHL